MNLLDFARFQEHFLIFSGNSSFSSDSFFPSSACICEAASSAVASFFSLSSSAIR